MAHTQGIYCKKSIFPGLGSLQATYSTSYPMPDLFPLSFFPAIDLSWPLSLKINAFTLIKIILKIIIFKMIVKFIGTVCLLLFLPKLISKKEHHSDDEEDDSRGFTDKRKSSDLLCKICKKKIYIYISYANFPQRPNGYACCRR